MNVIIKVGAILERTGFIINKSLAGNLYQKMNMK